MQKIKFGTDGWRAIIAKDYTLENVLRLAYATGQWLKQQGGGSLVIGHDCRFGGPMFARETARLLANLGLRVHLAPDFVSTPMVSLGVLRFGADLGIVITASHNPPEYNGFKLKSKYGGPSIPSEIAAVESLVPDVLPSDLPNQSFEALLDQGLIQYADLETLYLEEVQQAFDLERIEASRLVLAYDAMFGAGQRVMGRILPASKAHSLHCQHNPSFEGQAPEPILRNLQTFAQYIKDRPNQIDLGLANDGDADRIGLFDERGEFVDSHKILLLLVHYLHYYKKLEGKVVVTFSVSDKIKKLCQHYGLAFEVKKIGFKYIAETMLEEAVLVGGEESGGIAAMGHIPERDGIWIGLLILEFMAKTGKSLRALLDEIYEIVGPFAFDRSDLHLDNEQKQRIIEACQGGGLTEFGAYRITKMEDLDGFKYYFGEDAWVMVRPSGTEPVLRIYAQAHNQAEVNQILAATTETLLRY